MTMAVVFDEDETDHDDTSRDNTNTNTNTNTDINTHTQSRNDNTHNSSNIKASTDSSRRRSTPAAVVADYQYYLGRILLQGVVHLGCLVLYLVPIVTALSNEYAGPTLDEAHVMSVEVQQDIHNPDVSWTSIFSNDYWGRPMHSSSSHKSWRPFTILSFRYLKGPFIHLTTKATQSQILQQLTVHRLVNILLHAAIADLVGHLATQLFLLGRNNGARDRTQTRVSASSFAILHSQPRTQQVLLQLIIKIMFCLHPTHVEVTANAANRNHLLAVFCGVIVCFPGRTTNTTGTRSPLASPTTMTRITTPFGVFLFALMAGYLASETFLFMIPGVMVTMTVIMFNSQNHENKGTITNDTSSSSISSSTISHTQNLDASITNDETTQHEEHPTRKMATGTSSSSSSSLSSSVLRTLVLDYLSAILAIGPRLVLLVVSVLVYYGSRWYYETLDIPTGLIRPAEAPYYHFEGGHRVRNYVYVVTVHLGKQWSLVLPPHFGGDPLGFSHEYGYDCVPEIQSWDDPRFVFGVGFHFLFALLVVSIGLVVYQPRTYFGWVAIHWSWTLGTLFPICGLVKVGTFISDRIVVPSTVVVSMWLGYVLYRYLTEWLWDTTLPFRYGRPLQLLFLAWWLVTSYLTVHDRSLDWMDSISLMKSALVTCPRFAKVHMEVSKIYSGLYPTLLDLKKARTHLDTARAIDPDLCDLHKQYVFLAIREGGKNYRELEDELTQAMLCRFTMGDTEPLWQQYWTQTLASAPMGTPQRTDIENRYRHAMSIVQQAIIKEQQEEEEQQQQQQQQKLQQ